jgi:hypothetical protein
MLLLTRGGVGGHGCCVGGEYLVGFRVVEMGIIEGCMKR